MLALLAPLATGGGHDVVPPDQLVALPVRPATQFLGGLVLAPFDLVWIVQLLGLTALTSCLTLGGSLERGAATTAAYVLAITCSARRWPGRWSGCAGPAPAAGPSAPVPGRRSPPRWHWRAPEQPWRRGDAVRRVSGADRRRRGDRRRRRSPRCGGARPLRRCSSSPCSPWARAAACRWALRRPGDVGAPAERGPVRRRAGRRGALRELVAVDRASVWRAPALRRGRRSCSWCCRGCWRRPRPAVAVAGRCCRGWSRPVTALLFGINAFCLDGSGLAVAGLAARDPVLLLRSKALVLTETVLGGGRGRVRRRRPAQPGLPPRGRAHRPRRLGAAVHGGRRVLSLHASLRRPFRADLADPVTRCAARRARPREPAPGLPTAAIGMVLAVAAGTGEWWLPPALALPVLGLCALSAARTTRLWRDPVHRAFVVHRVANG